MTLRVAVTQEEVRVVDVAADEGGEPIVLEWPVKDPDEVLDYSIDWSARLDGDTISSSTWTYEPGITVDSEAHDTTTTTLWLSGGELSTSYRFTNRIVTAANRTMDQSVRITVHSK